MLEMQVTLDFVCCSCGHPVGVTLKCEGKGLEACQDETTTVKVPCPTCHNNNQIFFTPSGTLERVIPERKYYHIPEPSYN